MDWLVLCTVYLVITKFVVRKSHFANSTVKDWVGLINAGNFSGLKTHVKSYFLEHYKDAEKVTGNEKKVKKYLSNFNKVEELMKNVKLRDELKNFQSPVTGKEIMETFKLKPGKKVGMIKKMIEEAILDAEIENTHEDAFAYMMKNKDSFK